MYNTTLEYPTKAKTEEEYLHAFEKFAGLVGLKIILSYAGEYITGKVATIQTQWISSLNEDALVVTFEGGVSIIIEVGGIADLRYV